MKGMKKYKIRSVILTILFMQKWNLITKEAMDNLTMQKDDKQNESIDDDLESLFRDLQHEKISESSSFTHFLSQLTEKEQKQVDQNDLNYFKSLRSVTDTIDKGEIQLSSSELKFVRGQAWRQTSIIKKSISQNCCSAQ